MTRKTTRLADVSAGIVSVTRGTNGGPPRPLDADHQALALVQRVLVGKQRGGVAIGADAEQDEIEARRARVSELALVVVHGVVDPELSTDPPHIGP